MPDQSSAATEHALIQEITAPLASLPEDPVPMVADVDFPLALRGYDRLAVDAYVKKTSQLVAELQATRSPDTAIRRALERVGEEVSGILQRAHETAEGITSQSRSEAEDRLDAARKEAAEITAGADNRLKDLDAETDRIWAERHRIVEDTRELARQLLVLADTAAERFPPAEDTGSTDMPVAASGADEAVDAGDPDGTEPEGTPIGDAELDGVEPPPDPELFPEDEDPAEETVADEDATRSMPPVIRAEDRERRG
jgi:DivIVA protein